MITKSIGIFCLALGLAGNATILRAGDEKLSADLKSQNLAANVEVIVQYKVAPTEAHHQKVASLGGKLNRRLDFIKAAHYTLPKSTLQTMANDPDVAYITPDRALHAHLDQADATIGASLAASYNVNGAGVGVAVIDSGIGYHPDLKGRIVHEEQFITGNTDDVFGHGTHVAGIIAGSGLMSTGSLYFRTFKGVAPGVSLIDLQVLDQNGNGTDSGVIAALQQAIALKATYNIRVVNLSLGRPVYESY